VIKEQARTCSLIKGQELFFNPLIKEQALASD
jgi:hypothetical protein